MTTYDLDRLNAKPILTLSIFEAAIDWGYKDDAIQALTQGNGIVSLKKQPPEWTDEADLHTLDTTQSPLSLPFWCSYVYAYNPNTNDWTVYNAHGNVIQLDNLPND